MATDRLADPWSALRARLPGYSILRIIDLERAAQAFQIVRADRSDLNCSEYVLDGCTLIRPESNRSAEEIAEIIKDYDEAWRTARVTESVSAD